MTKDKAIVPVKSVNDVDISPLLREMIEYTKDQNALGDQNS